MRSKAVDAAAAHCYHPGHDIPSPDISAGKISMTAPHQIENTANVALAELLQPMLPGYEVRGEQTQTVADYPGRHPDVLITAAGRSPVVIEAEYEPDNPEADARQRLGLGIGGEIRPVEAAIALRYPESIGTADNPSDALAAARMPYCILYENGSRFPESGWLEGGIADLAELIGLVSVPQRAVDEAAAALERGIDRAANVIEEMGRQRPAITPSIARLLGMADVPQTRRMAGAIIANALIFHERIAGMHDGVRPLRLVCGADVSNPQYETLAAWAEILNVNYWAIFAIGRDILNQLPAAYANRILRQLEFTVGEVSATGVNNSHDLTGRIFQRLIADRKYLATYYTLPPSAALLARLAVGKLNGIDWSDADAIGRLRIGDFACGTGALLSAVYQQIAARHTNSGGDAANLHQMMMQEVLYGCDVMPSAIHITGSTLSGIAPSVRFDNARLYTLAYGRQQDGGVRIGSLELLQSSSVMTLFNTSDPAQRTGSAGEETASQIIADVPDAGFDLVIMNPPFTSNTKHRDAAGKVQNAAFAAFGASVDDQDEMADRLTDLAQGSHYHGHAGLGAAFATIADKKVRPGGVIALLILFTAINGPSWAKFRRLIAEQYTDVDIISIAANGTDMSFSSDTGVAECMVIARRKTGKLRPTERARFVSLRRRPRDFVEAYEVANAIVASAETRHIEDGPYGGIFIKCGDGIEPDGEILDAPISNYADGWGAARLLDAAVAQTAHALTTGRLWLPPAPEAQDLPIAPLHEIGQRGLDSQLFISAAHRGPFTRSAPRPTADYPALWNHNALRETRMVCAPDWSLRVRPGFEARAAEVWATASRCHLNREFTFGSQALAVAFTEFEAAGGRVWPNVIFDDQRFDYAFAIWGNSTLGLLCHWWHASRQQSSKVTITIRSAASLSVLDFRALTDEQLATAQVIFDDFRDKELMPAYLADADPNRALLDRRVLCDLLGFDAAVYQAARRLTAKWCAEPSVHGGKARPRSAKFVA